MLKHITESQLADLEKRAMLVESEYVDGLKYAIDRKGRGMWIISGNTVLPVARDEIEIFASEFIAVWDHMRPRTV